MVVKMLRCLRQILKVRFQVTQARSIEQADHLRTLLRF